jgi:hypothetical protein
MWSVLVAESTDSWNDAVRPEKDVLKVGVLRLSALTGG